MSIKNLSEPVRLEQLAEEAAGIVARSLPGYGVTGCYKQMPEWSWRGTRYE